MAKISKSDLTKWVSAQVRAGRSYQTIINKINASGYKNSDFANLLKQHKGYKPYAKPTPPTATIPKEIPAIPIKPPTYEPVKPIIPPTPPRGTPAPIEPIPIPPPIYQPPTPINPKQGQPLPPLVLGEKPTLPKPIPGQPVTPGFPSPLPGELPPQPQPRTPLPGGAPVTGGTPITTQPPFDITTLPNWDKLTPNEQAMLRAIVDNINSPIDLSKIPAFNFDEALARQSATTEYQPFYGEKLTDTLNQINLAKQRAEEDFAKQNGISTDQLRQELENINTQRSGLASQQQRSLEDYQRQAQQAGLQQERYNQDIAQQRSEGMRDLANQYAERGLTFSGIRNQGEQQFAGDLAQQQQRYLADVGTQQQAQTAEEQRRLQDISTGFEQLSRGELNTRGSYGNQQDLLAQARQRTLEDLANQQNLSQRDIGRQQTAAIEGGVLQRRGEALQPYWYYFNQLAGTNQ